MTKFLYSRSDEKKYSTRLPISNEMLAKYTFPYCAIKQHSVFPGLYLPTWLKELRNDFCEKWDISHNCYGPTSPQHGLDIEPNGLTEEMCLDLISLLNDQNVIAFYQMKQEFNNDQT
jgi:hypothetical protein